MLESERFKNAVDATAKSTGGMAPLNMWEKQLAMESAERAAMTAESERAQKAVEGLSKDRSELQRAGLKDATTLSAAEIRADSHGADKKDKKEPKGPKIYAAKDYIATQKLLNDIYSFGPIKSVGDHPKVAAVTSAAAAAKMDPNELYGIVSGLQKTGLDNTFDEKEVLDAIAAKKPVLTGGGYAGSNTITPGKFASLDPMAGYAELLKQKDAAYIQAAAKAANMPLTQADVLAARNAKGATQLDELIAKLGATTGKAEVKPETREIPAPVTKVDDKSVKTDNTKKMASDGLNKDGTLNSTALKLINDSIAYTGKTVPEGTTPAQANAMVDTITKGYANSNSPTSPTKNSIFPVDPSGLYRVDDEVLNAENIRAAKMKSGAETIYDAVKKPVIGLYENLAGPWVQAYKETNKIDSTDTKNIAKAGLGLVNSAAYNALEVAGSPYTATKMFTDWLITGESHGSAFTRQAEIARANAAKALEKAGVTDPSDQQLAIVGADLLVPGSGVAKSLLKGPMEIRAAIKAAENSPAAKTVLEGFNKATSNVRPNIAESVLTNKTSRETAINIADRRMFEAKRALDMAKEVADRQGVKYFMNTSKGRELQRNVDSAISASNKVHGY